MVEIFFFKPSEAKRKQPQNPFSLDEILADLEQYHRVRNHIILGLLCDFVPQVVIPDSETYQQAHAAGELTLEKISGKKLSELLRHSDFSFDSFLGIIDVAFAQMKMLYEKYGLVLGDRSLDNMLVRFTEDGGFDVVQLDLETLIDISGIDRMSAPTLANFASFNINSANIGVGEQHLIHNELVVFVDNIYCQLRAACPHLVSEAECRHIFELLYRCDHSFSLRTFDSVEQQLDQLNEFFIEKTTVPQL